MKELILITCYWAHLIATALWIGGIIFILFFAMQSSRHVLGAESGKLMGDISKRFTPAANLSIVTLVITGAVLAGLSRQYSGVAFLENNWSSALTVKSILVFGMVAVHFYRGLVLGSKIMRTTADTEKKSLQKLSINLVKVNFALGLLVLLISGHLSILRGF
ncbi:MAG: CopD family protein [Nitrospinae bacterium]|nr:CopD family protein [Nitrospinota bacterium]